MILRAGERGAEMVEQLLRLGRATSEDFATIDLVAQLPEMLDLLRVRLPPDVRLDVDLDPDTPPVRANLAQIQQVLLNLLDNAVYAMRGRGEVRVIVRRRGNGVAIEVHDTGPGIPPEHLPHVFQPFWTSHPEDGGAGMGLAMVQRIAHWHDGRVEIDSKPGHGTTVRLLLPLAQQAAQQQAEPVPALDAHSPLPRPVDAAQRLHGRRVLVVDDEPQVLRVHKAMLTKAGMQTIAARSGEDAIARLDDDPSAVDAAVLDFRMPGMNGLELARALRARYPQLPIAILTGYGEDDALRAAARLGVHIVDKPVSYRRLVGLLSQMLAEADTDPRATDARKAEAGATARARPDPDARSSS